MDCDGFNSATCVETTKTTATGVLEILWEGQWYSFLRAYESGDLNIGSSTFTINNAHVACQQMGYSGAKTDQRLTKSDLRSITSFQSNNDNVIQQELQHFDRSGYQNFMLNGDYPEQWWKSPGAADANSYSYDFSEKQSLHFVPTAASTQGKFIRYGGGFFCAFDSRGYLPPRLVECDRHHDPYFVSTTEDDYAAAIERRSSMPQGALGYDPTQRRPVNMTAMLEHWSMTCADLGEDQCKSDPFVSLSCTNEEPYKQDDLYYIARLPIPNSPSHSRRRDMSVGTVAFSPDGSMLAVTESELDGLTIYNTTSWGILFANHTGVAHVVAWSPDSTMLAGQQAVGNDARIVVWRVATVSGSSSQLYLHEVDSHLLDSTELGQTNRNAVKLTFSPGGTMLAIVFFLQSTANSRHLYVMDLAANANPKMQQIMSLVGASTQYMYDAVWRAGPCGGASAHLIFSTRETLQSRVFFMSADTWALSAAINISSQGEVKFLALSPDGDDLIVGEDSQYHYVSVTCTSSELTLDEKLPSKFNGHHRSFADAAFSPEGSRVAVLTQEEGTVELFRPAGGVWDANMTRTGYARLDTITATDKGLGALTWSPNGEILAVNDNRGALVAVFRVGGFSYSPPSLPPSTPPTPPTPSPVPVLPSGSPPLPPVTPGAVAAQAVVVTMTSSAPCEGFDIGAVVRSFMLALSLQAHQVSGSFTCASVIVTLAARAETAAEVSRLVQTVNATFGDPMQASSLLGITVIEVSAPQVAVTIFVPAPVATGGGGLSGGAIVGIVMGSLAGAGLLAAVAFHLSKGGGLGLAMGMGGGTKGMPAPQAVPSVSL